MVNKDAVDENTARYTAMKSHHPRLLSATAPVELSSTVISVGSLSGHDVAKDG